MLRLNATELDNIRTSLEEKVINDEITNGITEEISDNLEEDIYL